MLTGTAYASGCASLAVMLLAVGFAALRLRRALVPSWSGGRARLAEIVLGLSVVVVLLELFGAVGLLRPVPILVVGPALIAAVARWTPPGNTLPAPIAVTRSRAAGAFALALVAVVGMQWLAHATPVFEGGFRDMDSLRYHGPFVARWLQDHSLLPLQHTSTEVQETFFPANAELVGSLGVLAFGRDVLAPLLNFGWFALGALAAWSAGRTRWGRAAALAGYAALWSTPLLATIEAGSAKNDIAAVALTLATGAFVACALDGDTADQPGALVLAGLAGGLAVGTKLSTLAAVAMLLAGVIVVVRPRARFGALVAASAATTGGFWYLRNLLATGNPLPWIHHLGPLTLGGPAMTAAATGGWSVLHYARDRWFWATTVPAGLESSFGPLWPLLVLGAAALAVAVAVGRRVDTPRRIVALAALAAGAAYLVTPYGAGGSLGHPRLFALDLRFLAPALALACTLATTRRRAYGVLAASAAVVAVDQRSAGGRWPVPAAGVLVTGVAVVAVLAAGVALMRVAPARTSWVAASIASIAIAAAGWAPANDLLHDRYANVHSGVTAAFAMFQHTSHLRIAVGGFADDYPLYGADLTNHVQVIGVAQPQGGFRRARTCDEWRDALVDGRYDYVVVSRSPVARQRLPVEAMWTETDPAFRLVLDRGVTRVFRRVTTGEPETCPQLPTVARSSS